MGFFLSESDSETIKSGTNIELSSKHVTVHQTSEEESSDEDHQRRAASLGDLSAQQQPLSLASTAASAHHHQQQQQRSSTNNGTLERAQSLELTDNHQASMVVSPKKRKAPTANPNEMDVEFQKEPRLMHQQHEPSNLLDSTAQNGRRLKSAYEWGNLEDAIYDQSNNGTAAATTNHSDGDDSASEEDTKPTSSSRSKKFEATTSNTSLDSSFVKQVMSVADNFEKSASDENVSRQMDKLNQERNEILSKVAVESVADHGGVVVIQEQLKPMKNESFNITWGDNNNEHVSTTEIVTTSSKRQQSIDLPNSLENNIRKFINSEARHMDDVTNFTYKAEPVQVLSTTTSTRPLHFHQYVENDSTPQPPTVEPRTTTTMTMMTLNNVKDASAGSDQVKIINYGTNMPDDVKVSRYPIGSLEHLEAVVNTKLLAQQMALEEEQPTTTLLQHRGSNATTTINTSKTTINSATPPPTPASPPFMSGNFMLGGSVENNETVATTTTPVFSSDGQGVNSISISSMEVAIRPDSRRSAADHTTLENVVTITSTDDLRRTGSQPSSIIQIDDERLDFTLRTLDEIERPQFVDDLTVAAKNEVFIIESLSSKKVTEPTAAADKTTFITEIRVKTDEDVVTEADESNGKTKIPLSFRRSTSADDSPTATPSSPSSPPSTPSSMSPTSAQSPKKSQSDDDYGIPRNSEIRFTTATYESPSRLHYGLPPSGDGRRDSRSSQIDHIRSTFERHHSQSEIPVPVRKTSIPSLRTSPSKIPVFNSGKSGGGGDLSRKSSNGSIHSSNGSINNNSINYSNNNTSVSPTGGAGTQHTIGLNGNRVNVTVTSIKNSSRNPSGK